MTDSGMFLADYSWQRIPQSYRPEKIKPYDLWCKVSTHRADRFTSAEPFNP